MHPINWAIVGAYIMPPFGRVEMAVQILECLGEDWKKVPQTPKPAGS